MDNLERREGSASDKHGVMRLQIRRSGENKFYLSRPWALDLGVTTELVTHTLIQGMKRNKK